MKTFYGWPLMRIRLCLSNCTIAWCGATCMMIERGAHAMCYVIGIAIKHPPINYVTPRSINDALIKYSLHGTNI